MAKKRRYQKKKKTVSKIDLVVITLIVFSVLLAVLIYTKSGLIGIKLNEVLGGIMGVMQYVLPIGIFTISIKLACEGRETLTSKLIQYGVFLISLAIVFSVFQISAGELQSNKELSEVVKDAYFLGTQSKGGGAIGAVAAIPLAKLLGDVGALILCIGVAVVLLVFTFGINLSDMISQMVEKMQERREERLEEKEQRIKLREQSAERETVAQRRKREREERLAQKELEKQAMQEKNPMENQIKINFGGRIIDEPEKTGLKKYDHSGEDLEPLTKNTKKAKTNIPMSDVQPDVLENNLFRQEEEQKEEKKKEVLQLEHAMIVEDEHYEYPPVELLSKASKKTLKGGAKALTDTATKLQKTLYSFGVSAKVENVSVGPAITRYELKPAEGVRVSKIANLADDIALNLAAETIRIEAPIPGKQAVGIEVPNKEKEAVHLREVLESEEFSESSSKLTVALGKDVAGNIQLADIAKMPHLLIAGSTGSGKSVCINTIITSIIYKSKPSEVKMVMVDPKVVELSVYNGIPHLLIPVVTDPKKAAGALHWAVTEMDDRYQKFADASVRDIKSYNKKLEEHNYQLPINSNGELGTFEKMPEMVVIVDELADLMMVAAKEVEESICRLAQKARAAGIYLILATQRPSVDVVTGLIKANMPSRIAFAVNSGVDSRTILDMFGAEKLLGNGDMLYYPQGYTKPLRVQGAFVSDEEVQDVVDYIKGNNEEASYDENVTKHIESGADGSDGATAIGGGSGFEDTRDSYFAEAGRLIVSKEKGSIGMLQRNFKIGFNRAARIMDQLEEAGVVGPEMGTKPRTVHMTPTQFEQFLNPSAVSAVEEEYPVSDDF